MPSSKKQPELKNRPVLRTSRSYIVYCPKCKSAKALGDDDVITLEGEPYEFTNPLDNCGKCFSQLQEIRTDDPLWPAACDAYDRLNKKQEDKKKTKKGEDDDDAGEEA